MKTGLLRRMLACLLCASMLLTAVPLGIAETGDEGSEQIEGTENSTTPSSDVTTPPSNDVTTPPPSNDVTTPPPSNDVTTPPPSSDVTQTPSGDVTQTPSGDVTQTPSGDVTQTPSGDVTQTPSGDVTQTPKTEVETCAHPETATAYQFTEGSKVYSSGENGKHHFTAKGLVIVSCKSCLKEISRTDITPSMVFAEPHKYRVNESGEAVCVCGKLCPHDGAPTLGDPFTKDDRYTDNEDGTHEHAWDIYQDSRCSTCFQLLGTEKTGSDARQEAHVYGENGVCVCRKPCPHDSAVPSGDPFTKDDRYTDNEDGTHEHAWDIYQNTQCSACGSPLSAVKTGSDARQEAHVYGENGVCVCGAKQCPHEDCRTRFVYRNETAEDSGIPGLHWRVRDVYIHYACNACGAEWTSEEPVQEENAELVSCRYGEDGVCADCGAEKQACGHERAYEEINTQWLETISSDEAQHTGRVSIYSRLYCPDCGEWLGEPTLLKEDLTVTEAHHFATVSAGEMKCTQCGAEKTCAHEQTETVYENVLVNWDEDMDDEGNVLADAEKVTRCAQCAQELSREVVRGVRIDAQTALGSGMLMASTLDAECKHTSYQSTLVMKNQRYTSNSDRTHTFTYDLYAHYICKACGYEWDSATPLYANVTTTEACLFVDGECRLCHQEEETVCTHPNRTRVREIDYSTVKVIASDRSNHVLKADIISYLWCPDCLETSDFKLLQKDAIFNESHSPYTERDEKGTLCGRCGYRLADQSTCKHEKLEELVMVRAGVQPEKYTDITAKTHTAVYSSAEVIKVCLTCGKKQDTQVKENVKDVEGHTYGKDNVCTACGYKNTCTHKNAKTVKEYDLIHDIRVVSSEKHSFFADQWEYWTCPDCGAYSEDKLIAENKRFEASHAYNGTDICWFCGMKKPVPTPTPRRSSSATAVPTVTPTPVPLRQDVVSAMLEAVDSALLESRTADVVVLGAQEIMTTAEYSTLRTLTLREQMLVTLSAIGLSDAVSDAIVTLRLKVSDEALKLMDAIDERIAQMTVQEKAELEKLLAKYFPVTERISGGIRTRIFTIELQIVVEDFGRVERYQFYLDTNGEWIFERVDLTDFGRVG